MAKSLVKDSEELRKALVERWQQVLGKGYQKKVADDANAHGRKDVFRAGVNRYIRSPYAYNALKEDAVIWLAVRWCIEVKLSVSILPYDEKLALRNVRQLNKINESQRAKPPGDQQNV